MNDPLEGSVFNQVIKTYNHSEENKESIEENKKIIGNFLNELYPSNDIIVDSNTYIVSFSNAKKENLPIWINYGADSIGAKIEIPTSFFDKEYFKTICYKDNTKKESCCLYSVLYLESTEDTYKLDGVNIKLNSSIQNIYSTLTEIAKYNNNLKK